MEWVAAVVAAVGIGVMAGWIYAGLPGLRKFRAPARRGQETNRAPASNQGDRRTKATWRLASGVKEPIPVIERRTR